MKKSYLLSKDVQYPLEKNYILLLQKYVGALVLIVAGSQGQENSALSRIVNGESKEIKLNQNDLVIFSADPIPGNETSVYELIDAIVKKGTKVIYSAVSREFHVSGHGSLDDLGQLITTVKPKVKRRKLL